MSSVDVACGPVCHMFRAGAGGVVKAVSTALAGAAGVYTGASGGEKVPRDGMLCPAAPNGCYACRRDFFPDLQGLEWTNDKTIHSFLRSISEILLIFAGVVSQGYI